MRKNNSSIGIIAITLIASFLFTSVGCSMISGAGDDNCPPPMPLSHFSPEKNLHTRWTAQVGSGANRSHTGFETAVRDNAAYTVDSSGRVTAINVTNGKMIWSANLKGCPSSGPAVQSGYLVFGTHNGEVVALNSGNGNLIWHVRMSTELLAPPRIAGQWVLIKTVDAKVTALRLQTGQTCWCFSHKAPLIMLQKDSAPVISGDKVFVGFGSGEFCALALRTGQLLWEQKIAVPRGLNELDSMVNIIADPIVCGSMVYVAAYQGKLVALSTQTGQILWERVLSTYNNFSVQGNLIVVADEQGVIWGINRFNGCVLWQQKCLLNRQLTAPLITSGEIWVGDFEGNLHVLSTKDGHFVARCLIDGSGLFVQPVFYGNGVLLRSAGGSLVKVD